MFRVAISMLACLASALPTKADPANASKNVFIKNVTIIDVGRPSPVTNQSVLIVGDRILRIGKDAELAIPAGAEVVEGSNKFLIPGLWDMHVHIASPTYLGLFVANGVTGVRDMHAFFPDSVFGMRQSVREGKLLGPRIIAAGALVDGDKPIWPGSHVATNPSNGREAVRELKKRGADFVKVYSKLSREAYLAIALEAKELKMPFVGHVPEAVNAIEASDAGQKSMEHLYGIPLACSSQEDQLRKEEIEQMGKIDNQALRGLLRRTQEKALDTFDDSKARRLVAKLALNKTWQTPTLTVLRAFGNLDDPKFIADSRVKYIPAYIKSQWPKDAKVTPARAESLASMRRLYEFTAKFVTRMHQAGIPILAGTDVTNAFCFPGFSLHDELYLLVGKSGLSPIEALRTATLNPAKFLGLDHELGTVEEGKIADLVLLDANPLENIKNTARIRAVFVNGNLHDRARLDKLLADADTTKAGN